MKDVYEKWYPSGQLEVEEYFKNGKNHGTHRGWHENGQLDFEVNYRDGYRHGPETDWDENGKILYRWLYCRGKIVKGYLPVWEDIYIGLPNRVKLVAWSSNPNRGKDNIFCGEGRYWVIRCNICNGLSSGTDSKSLGIDWHKECQSGMVQPEGKEPFKARLVNVTRWHSMLGYLWLEDDSEVYL